MANVSVYIYYTHVCIIANNRCDGNDSNDSCNLPIVFLSNDRAFHSERSHCELHRGVGTLNWTWMNAFLYHDICLFGVMVSFGASSLASRV